MQFTWEKAATAAFAMLALLAGWGLKKVYDVDIKVTKIETKIEILLTPLPEKDIMPAYYQASMPPRQNNEFLQKVMLRAVDQILVNQNEGAVQTLLIGLDHTGLSCSVTNNTLTCR